MLPSKEVADGSFVKYYRSFGRSSYLVKYNILYSVTFTLLYKLVFQYPHLPSKFFRQKVGDLGCPFHLIDSAYIIQIGTLVTGHIQTSTRTTMDDTYFDYIWYISYRWVETSELSII